MSELSLKQVVQNHGGAAADVLKNTGQLSVKYDLFGGDYGAAGQASLRDRLEQLLGSLWGVADLHAHPAMHLGFGARLVFDELREVTDGEEGPLHGNPGWLHDSIELADYEHFLPACGHCHTGGLIPPEVLLIRGAIIGGLLKTGHPHTEYGYPLYDNWPHAKSPIHQQMYVSWIHRAYRAGLRLMVASVTDSNLLTDLWKTEIGYYQGRGGDKQAAINQLNFIHAFVEANSSWMSIVRNAAEARQTIEGNKLAVVLGLEMDMLSPGEIIDLASQCDVRVVTPIHTVDNPHFGGAAVYEDSEVFKIANLYLNGYLFEVEPDASIEFRFDPNIFTSLLGPEMIALLKTIIGPELTYHAPYAANPEDGHRNAKGLVNAGNLVQLMQAGLIIDVAHMSDKCIDETIATAQADGRDYPLLNTHTGIRPTSEYEAKSERDLRREHAIQLAELGGLIGLGTGPADPPVNEPIRQWHTLCSLIGGGAVALGTDMNGLSEQIAANEVDVLYDPSFTIPNVEGPFFQLTVGTKHFNFKDDGLAHYGMLPEFLYALSVKDQTETGKCLEALFSSADAFVKMWELVEEAQSRV